MRWSPFNKFGKLKILGGGMHFVIIGGWGPIIGGIYTPCFDTADCKYRLKFQMAMNDVYFFCLREHATYKIGLVSGLDYVILLSQGVGVGS